MKRTLLTLYLCIPLVGTAIAKEIQSVESISQAAEAFALEKVRGVSPNAVDIEVRVGRIDQRLKLAACDLPLATDIKHSSAATSRFTVEVSCEGSNPWSLYVPVSTKRYNMVAIAKRRLDRDSVITADDIIMVRKELGQLRSGYIQDINRIVGKKAKRSILSRSVIRDHALVAPSDIHKGENVVISATSSLIKIRMAGTALDDGSIGEIIKVKNLSSNKIIEAEVIRPGVVQIRM